MSDDFPAFGRPTMASARGWLMVAIDGPAGRTLSEMTASEAGKSESIVSNRPEMPRPCAALIGIRIREAKSREITLQIFVFRVIDLIDYEDDRRLRFAQDSRELLIDRRESVLRVHHKQNHVAFAHGGIRRAPNLHPQLDFAGAANSSRVPNRKRPPPAHAGSSQPVASDAGLIVHDRDVPTGEPVKERRFAYIGAADDGDFAHAFGRVFRCMVAVALPR